MLTLCIFVHKFESLHDLGKMLVILLHFHNCTKKYDYDSAMISIR